MAANPSIQLGTDGNWAIKEDNLLAYKKDGTRFFNKEFDFSRSSLATFVDKDGLIKVSGITSTELVVNGGFDTDTNWTKGNGAYISEGKGNIIGDGSSFTNLSQSNVFTVGKFYKVTLDAVINSGLGLKVQDGSTNENFGFITTSGTYTFYSQANHSSLVIGRRTGGTVFDSYVDNVSVVEIQLDVPRIDFKNNTTGHLLLEPQSTNLLPYSEDFSSSSWTKNNCTIISNNSISPDGTQNADKLNFTTSNGEIVRTTSFTSGQQYTMSFYAKTESGTLNFKYGNVSYENVSGTATTEWQKFEITQTPPTASRYPKIQTTEIGSLLLWGFQVEELPYASSYIPTNGSVATRLKDQAYKSGISNLINSDEGVLYAEFSGIGNDDVNRLISLSDGTTSNRVIIQYTTTNNLLLRVISGGNYSMSKTQTISDITDNFKVAIKYKENDFACWIDGVEVHRDTLGAAPIGLNRLGFDNSGDGIATYHGKVKDLRVYTTALSDEDLQKLTT